MRGWTRVLRGAASPVFLACLIAACATWTPRQFDGSLEDGTYVPGIARVTLRDSTRLEMRDVRVSPDSVTGIVRSSYGQSTRVSVPASTVASIHERDISTERTALLLVVLGAAAAGVFLAAMAAAMGPGY